MSHRIQLTHTDKLFWPHITKGQLISYYQTIAPYMLPYLLNRPITAHVYPNGVSAPGFYIRNIPEYAPKWIKTAEYTTRTEHKVDHLPLITTEDDLVWFANFGCVEFHVWNAHIPNLDRPDQVIFDLDAKEASWDEMCITALYIKEVLDQRDIISFPKTTGINGMHIYIPITPSYSFSQTKAWAQDIANSIAHEHPEDISNDEGNQHHGPKVAIDCGQNNLGRNTAAPYSLRATTPIPFVSTPLTWNEVGGHIPPDTFTIDSILKRLSTTPDPFKDMLTTYNTLN